MKTDAWPHQRDALAFVLAQDVKRRSAMLAMGMGTGKSRVVVELCQREKFKRVLILAPLSVLRVWPQQFERHEGYVRRFEVLDRGSGTQKWEQVKAALEARDGRPLVVVCNYDAFWRDPLYRLLKRQLWDLVVCDESHRIKSPGGKASRATTHLQSVWKLCLTGTPMPHSPMDIYAQYRFLDWTIFGTTSTGFRCRYARMGGYQMHQIMGWQNLDDLEERMRRICFRVGADVLSLPPVQHIERKFELEGETRRTYRDMEEDFIAQVDDGIITAANALSKLLRLQQITGGSVPVEGEDGERRPRRIGEEKAHVLADLLIDLGPHEPVVVFCRFHADMDAVRMVCDELGYSYRELSGRENQLSEWQSEPSLNGGVLAVQIQSGGVGVDLTRARYAIYYSLGFSLGDFEQSLARVHRPGQERPVVYYHLIARDTIDEKVYTALEKKASVIEEVLEGLKKEREVSRAVGPCS